MTAEAGRSVGTTNRRRAGRPDAGSRAVGADALAIVADHALGAAEETSGRLADLVRTAAPASDAGRPLGTADRPVGARHGACRRSLLADALAVLTNHALGAAEGALGPRNLTDSGLLTTRPVQTDRAMRTTDRPARGRFAGGRVRRTDASAVAADESVGAAEETVGRLAGPFPGAAMEIGRALSPGQLGPQAQGGENDPGHETDDTPQHLASRGPSGDRLREFIKSVLHVALLLSDASS